MDQLVQEKWGVIEVKRETFLGNSFGRSFGEKNLRLVAMLAKAATKGAVVASIQLQIV